MDLASLERTSEYAWRIRATGAMRVAVTVYGSEQIVREMDEKVREQARNVAMLPGIVKSVFVMPDGHWGYGFPIGAVAAFDRDDGGVVSAGGVGFDISCGVRLLSTGLAATDITERRGALADALQNAIPAGVGSTGPVRVDGEEVDAMLRGGAHWAVERGFGTARDLQHVEENGRVAGARPECVSARAKLRQRQELGTLGSGNHYLEVQAVTEVRDAALAHAFGMAAGDAVVSIHCGSRGLGHQIGSDFLQAMASQADALGVRIADRELACAPLGSELGEAYIGAMRAGSNCALANRQILTHFLRRAFSEVFANAAPEVIYDVSHNTCSEETHRIDGKRRTLWVHRKGATRALAPGDDRLPSALRPFGQPVLIGGTMGTASYVLAGVTTCERLALSSACHGAGRRMSRHQATREWSGRELLRALEQRGIVVRSPSFRGVAEEAPGAYKDITEVVESAEGAGLARIVARLEPLICIKG
jgi:tRNA-splicing ligase RtcB